MLAVLVGVLVPTVLVIKSSLMTNEVEFISVCFLAIQIFSFVKCVFRSLVSFSIGLCVFFLSFSCLFLEAFGVFWKWLVSGGTHERVCLAAARAARRGQASARRAAWTRELALCDSCCGLWFLVSGEDHKDFLLHLF